MAVIGDLSANERAALNNRVAARIAARTTSLDSPATPTVIEIALAAVEFVAEAAPKTPEMIAREAAIRLGGWMLDVSPALRDHEIADPSGTAVKLGFSTAATANGWRASGAASLCGRFIRRRAGAIG